MSNNRLNNRQCVSAIRNREGFSNSTGSFTAKWSAFISTGYAPQEVRDTLRQAITPDGTDPLARREIYVVYSYATPIAYAVPGGDLVVFTAKYSRTTSRHTSYCRQAA